MDFVEIRIDNRTLRTAVALGTEEPEPEHELHAFDFDLDVEPEISAAVVELRVAIKNRVGGRLQRWADQAQADPTRAS